MAAGAVRGGGVGDDAVTADLLRDGGRRGPGARRDLQSGARRARFLRKESVAFFLVAQLPALKCRHDFLGGRLGGDLNARASTAFRRHGAHLPGVAALVGAVAGAFHFYDSRLILFVFAKQRGRFLVGGRNIVGGAPARGLEIHRVLVVIDGAVVAEPARPALDRALGSGERHGGLLGRGGLYRIGIGFTTGQRAGGPP